MDLRVSRGGAAMVTCLLAAAPAGAQTVRTEAHAPEEARGFDFWLGGWDVLLRTLEEDGRWVDRGHADARVHALLDGKAVLELWDGPDVVGFSVRAWSPDDGLWHLWLNWPGPDRSGSGELTGAFRHGRGEFFAQRAQPDGDTLLARYTFSDITAESLRWDDSFSTDGGRTWSPNWIMEFTRTRDRVALSPEGGPAHTYHDGSRCSGEPFRRLDPLAGRSSGTFASRPAVLRGYRILDGCATMVVVEEAAPSGKEVWFGFLTFETALRGTSLIEIEADPASPPRFYVGGRAGTGEPALTLQERTEDGSPRRRIVVDLEPGRAHLRWETRDAPGAPWRPGRVASFELPSAEGEPGATLQRP